MEPPRRASAPSGPVEGRASRTRVAFRVAAITTWSLALVAFWYGTRQAGVGPLEYLFAGIDRVSAHGWAPAVVFGLYLVRPLLLVPISIVNLASGFVLGVLPGLGLALLGTLASASIGYAIGRQLGSPHLAKSLPERWSLLGLLHRNAFASVVAGGLMYLHADAVNLPAGLMRVRFSVFLAGIVLGNALTMSAAVLAGASVEGNLADASAAVDPAILVPALALFALSLALATWLRRRSTRARERAAGASPSRS